jgi:recombination protein RecT
MSIKTVLNRACKLLIRTSDDQVLYEDDDNKDLDRTKEDVNQEINDNANQDIIDVDFEEEEEIESIPNPTQTKTPPKTSKKPEPKEEPQPKESPKAGTQEKAF